MNNEEKSPAKRSRPLLAGIQVVPKAWLRIDLIAFLLIFFIFYHFKLSAFSLSIDDELGATRMSAAVWLVQGRWGIYLVEQVFRQQVVPFFPFFIFGCCMSASYALLLSAFGVTRSRFVHYLAFAIYAAFPVWVFALSFFSNAIGFGLGQLCAVFALYLARSLLLSPTPSENRLSVVLRSAALGAAAIGMYQSFIFTIATLGLCMIATAALKDDMAWRPAFRRVAALAAIGMVSIAIYEAVEWFFLWLTGLGHQHYIGAIVNLPALLAEPLHVSALVLQEMLRIYGGSSMVYGAPVYALGATLACGILALLSWPGIAPLRRVRLAIIIAVVLGLPFTLHVTAAGWIPARTLVAVPMVAWFFALLAMTSPHAWLARTTTVVVAVSLLQMLYVANLLQAGNEFARKHDEALAAAISTRIAEVNRGNTARPLLIDFYGGRPFDSVYPRPPSATEGFSFFEWDGGNADRMLAYLRLLGHADLQLPSPQQRHDNDSVFAQMPIWPDSGSVRMANGMTLVKLGALAGYR